MAESIGANSETERKMVKEPSNMQMAICISVNSKKAKWEGSQSSLIYKNRLKGMENGRTEKEYNG